MVKRKAKDLDNGISNGEPRRSNRRISNIKDDVVEHTPKLDATDTKEKKAPKLKKERENGVANGVKAPTSNGLESKQSNQTTPAKPTTQDTPPTGKQYWLMKAEPESRFEKGHDIKFSIDDLASKTVPEPWDGIRAYPARNNLRAMKKGDLAFFYHSSCKIPAIVGIMEIVEEHSPDLSAHDPSAPYHDASSTPDNPKWSIVHVAFRQKLNTPITLKELKAWQGEKGNALENMQMLKLGRLSVSRVSAGEWAFLRAAMEERGDVVPV